MHGSRVALGRGKGVCGGPAPPRCHCCASLSPLRSQRGTCGPSNWVWDTVTKFTWDMKSWQQATVDNLWAALDKLEHGSEQNATSHEHKCCRIGQHAWKPSRTRGNCTDQAVKPSRGMETQTVSVSSATCAAQHGSVQHDV